MSFVDVHIDWLISLGIPVLQYDEVAPVPGLPDQLPPEVGLWFDQRMPYRVPGFAGYAGSEGFWLDPTLTESTFITDPTYASEERTAGLFPLEPIGVADFVHYYLTVETFGPKSDWVFLNEAAYPETGGPIAKSLGQMFYAIRELTAVGLLNPTDHLAEPSVNAPPDTPWNLLGPFINRSKVVGTDYNPPDIFDQPPVTSSIRDLLPEFDFDFETI